MRTAGYRGLSWSIREPEVLWVLWVLWPVPFLYLPQSSSLFVGRYTTASTDGGRYAVGISGGTVEASR